MRKSFHQRSLAVATLALAAVTATTTATAAERDVTVTIQNLAPTNSVAFAPLHLGFHSGSFDAFNLGQVAGEAIVSVAEGGAGGAWQAAFATADPSATRGTIGGPLFVGQSKSATFRVDTTLNPYFSFAAMVIPSNDFFIGNDSATRFQLFDAAGQLPYDATKDGNTDGSQNVCVFNLNIDFIRRSCRTDCDRFQDFANRDEKRYLNRRASLGECVRRLAEGFDRFGVAGALYFHRGGASGWRSATSS